MKKQHLVTPQNRSLFDRGYRVMQGEQEFVTYQDGTSFRVWYMTEPDHYSRHYHAAVEVVLPHLGECRYIVEGTQYVVKSTECLFIPAGKMHSMDMPEGGVRNLILFDIECLSGIRGFSSVETLLNQTLYLTGEDPVTGEVRKRLFMLLEEYYSGSPLTNLACYSKLLDILVLIGNHCLPDQKSGASEGLATLQASGWEAVDRAVAYVSKHYTEEISLDQISEIAGFSKFHFARIFKRHTNMTFLQFLIHKRISVASHLLCNTDLPVVQVALQSGFSSLSTFNRSFKNTHGCTPTEYRILYEKEKADE